MVVRAAAAAMVNAVLLVTLCVSCVFVCGVQLLHKAPTLNTFLQEIMQEILQDVSVVTQNDYFFPANEILHDFLQKLIFAPVGRKLVFAGNTCRKICRKKLSPFPPRPSTPPSTIINSSEGPMTAMMTR